MDESITKIAIEYGRYLVQRVTNVACGAATEAKDWQTWALSVFEPDTEQLLPLRSLWTILKGRNAHRPKVAFTPVQPITLQADHETWCLNPGSEATDYQEQLKNLGELYVQHSGDRESNFDRFYGLMQKYASTLPCTYGEDGVSLFRQWTLVAAIMAITRGEVPDPNRHSLALIGLDLPGIQKAVYTIASRNAGKTVRGRSAFLQLLVNAIVDRLLDDLGLCRANVIINAGGNALILAGWSEILAGKLQEIDQAINRLLFQGNDPLRFAGFQGDLALALAHIQLPWSALKHPATRRPDEDLSEWQYYERQLKEKLGTVKGQPFATLLKSDGFDQLFSSDPVLSIRCCAVCQRPDPEPNSVPERLRAFQPINDNADEPGAAAGSICPVCATFRELADVLGKADKSQNEERFLNRRPKANGQTPSGIAVWQQALQTISGHIYRIEQMSRQDGLSLALSPDGFPEKGGHGYWPMATTTPHVTREDMDALRATGDDQVQEGAIRDNGLLAGDSPTSFKRIAILKGDVDDLGTLLVNGTRHRSAAQTAILSEALTLFFGSWLDKICVEDQFHNKVYVLYAGGDDFLILGTWHVIPLLAQRIAEDFRQYTGNNPGIHLSAGISVVGGKEPLYAAINAANEALKRAKRYPLEQHPTKNTICFIEQLFTWDDFRQVVAWQKTLTQMRQDKAPSALLITLIEIYEQYQDDHRSKQEKQLGYQVSAKQGDYRDAANHRTSYGLYIGPWLWNMVYRLHRFQHRGVSKEAINQIITQLLTERGVEKLSTSARWAQLLTRQKD